ncbi:MAG: hypothetical protein AB7F25_11970 [Deferribacterales bacterium]
MAVKEGTENFTDFQDRIRELHLVIKSCERHGVQADEHVGRLKKVVKGMEEIMKKSLSFGGGAKI